MADIEPLQHLVADPEAAAAAATLVLVVLAVTPPTPITKNHYRNDIVATTEATTLNSIAPR